MTVERKKSSSPFEGPLLCMTMTRYEVNHSARSLSRRGRHSSNVVLSGPVYTSDWLRSRSSAQASNSAVHFKNGAFRSASKAPVRQNRDVIRLHRLAL
jgi:hypothetical protein